MGLKTEDLKKAIREAFLANSNTDEQNSKIYDQTDALASALANAMEAFVKSGDVETDISNVSVNPNSGTQIPGTGKGIGKVK